MRGFDLYFGRVKRNQPLRLVNPRPLPEHGIGALESGNAGLDGFTVCSRQNVNAQGDVLPIKGIVGPVYQGPDDSFEQ